MLLSCEYEIPYCVADDPLSCSDCHVSWGAHFRTDCRSGRTAELLPGLVGFSAIIEAHFGALQHFRGIFAALPYVCCEGPVLWVRFRSVNEGPFLYGGHVTLIFCPVMFLLVGVPKMTGETAGPVFYLCLRTCLETVLAKTVLRHV